MMDEDWQLLVSFFPDAWRELASTTNALKGLRKDKSEEKLLRTLLIHLACGCSLRETVVRARKAGLADISDVALLKRLRKCGDWLRALCQSMLTERGLHINEDDAFQVRLFDATNVKEPGSTGSLWRIHYSVQLPSLRCDDFKLTGTEGEGVGESFSQFSIQEGDYIIADRGYSTAAGVEYVASRKAFVTVRVNYQSLPLFAEKEEIFPLLSQLKKIKRVGEVKCWRALIRGPSNTPVSGRVCVIRKSREAIRLAHKKLKRRASKNGQRLKKETLVCAEYIILFTTFPAREFSAAEVLDWYRVRWQIELVFKRFKQIAQLGHLPKHDEESARAWLYGKLFVALLAEKIIACAESISPWGYLLGQPATAKPLA